MSRKAIGSALIASAAVALVVAGGVSYAATTKSSTTVKTAADLTSALAKAKPGDVITLAAGTYDGAFFATTSGTASNPITLTGPSGAVLTNSTRKACDPHTPSTAGVTYCGYGLHLNKASYWKLSGFSVRDASKGIVLDASSHDVIDGVTVSDIDDEGIHFRTSSADDVLQNSSVHDTGKVDPGFGEGVYLGSAKSNWSKYGSGTNNADHSDRNQVLNNKLGPNVAAELIDIKEGTLNGKISGNTFDGTGVKGENDADSWLDVKGNGYQISDNKGTGPSGDVDGYQTHQQFTGFGCGNTFTANTSKLNTSGYAFDITDQSKCKTNPNVVTKSNTETGAKSGVANIPLT